MEKQGNGGIISGQDKIPATRPEQVTRAADFLFMESLKKNKGENKHKSFSL